MVEDYDVASDGDTGLMYSILARLENVEDSYTTLKRNILLLGIGVICASIAGYINGLRLSSIEKFIDEIKNIKMPPKHTPNFVTTTSVDDTPEQSPASPPFVHGGSDVPDAVRKAIETDPIKPSELKKEPGI